MNPVIPAHLIDTNGSSPEAHRGEVLQGAWVGISTLFLQNQKKVQGSGTRGQPTCVHCVDHTSAALRSDPSARGASLAPSLLKRTSRSTRLPPFCMAWAVQQPGPLPEGSGQSLSSAQVVGKGRKRGA